MIQHDGSGQPYVEFKNVRITVSTRNGDKDWEGARRYLTVRAYRDGASKALHPGPDIPIDNDRKAEDILIAAGAVMTLLTN